MEKQTDESTLKRNSILSAMSLFFQSGYASILGFAANLVLTILLSPKIFGIYITTLSIISLLNYFSDIGLAASLIQKKRITDEDIRTTFSIQQILIITLITIGLLASPFIRSFYGLPQEGLYLLWALYISFFLSSLKTIPSILLERSVQFQKIVLVQVAENTIFYLSVMFFAYIGYGLTSFTISVLLRALFGTIFMYSIAFWKPQIGISQKSFRELISFGLPFQANSFLALFKDDLITLYLGKVIGFEGLGYIGWAKKWAEAPIRIIMDNVSRVLFPVLSRLQDEKGRVKGIVEKVISYQTIILTPAILGLALIIPQLTHIIPKYEKWVPAIPLFFLFCLSAWFSSYSTPFINLLNAMGKSKKPFFFMLGWTVATWALTPILTHYFGWYGFPITVLTLSLSFYLVVREAKKLIPFAFFPSIIPGIGGSMFMGASVYAVELFIPSSPIVAVGAIAIGIITYLFVMKLLFRIDLIKTVIIILIEKRIP